MGEDEHSVGVANTRVRTNIDRIELVGKGIRSRIVLFKKTFEYVRILRSLKQKRKYSIC